MSYGLIRSGLTPPFQPLPKGNLQKSFLSKDLCSTKMACLSAEDEPQSACKPLRSTAGIGVILVVARGGEVEVSFPLHLSLGTPTAAKLS